ncbi:MAG TPA: hypothetical protein VK041_06615, partial [Opitutales bacterium]|nr:hypothetical protein [Opitutales bacterium]
MSLTIAPSLQQRLHQPYRRDEWRNILHEILDGALFLNDSPQVLQASHENVRQTLQLGRINLSDGNSVALLEVETSDQTKLARNRVSLRNFVASFIDEAGAAAVLAVFQQPGFSDWRLTYASRQTTLDEDTFEITTIETAPRRFTFLLGPDEPCRTPAGRLAMVREKKEDLTLTELEKAFSVEALSKEFFKRYHDHYERFVSELSSLERIADTRARFDVETEETEEAQVEADKPIRDFVKKLLGRLIFLHFLQKKGWMHTTADAEDWSSGDQDFLETYYRLAEKNGHADRFHSAYLTPLFFNALNTERENDLFCLNLPNGNKFTCRIPYLNGGLFDPEPESLRSLDLPPHLFADLFAFFSEYNFTIDE